MSEETNGANGWEQAAIDFATEEQLLAILTQKREKKRQLLNEYSEKRNALKVARDEAKAKADNEYSEALSALDQQYPNVAADYAQLESVDDARSADASEIEAAIMAKLEEAYPHEIPSNGFSKSLGFKRPQVRKVIDKLIAEGKVIQIGNAPKHRFKLAK